MVLIKNMISITLITNMLSLRNTISRIRGFLFPVKGSQLLFGIFIISAILYIFILFMILIILRILVSSRRGRLSLYNEVQHLVL